MFTSFKLLFVKNSRFTCYYQTAQLHFWHCTKMTYLKVHFEMLVGKTKNKKTIKMLLTENYHKV